MAGWARSVSRSSTSGVLDTYSMIGSPVAAAHSSIAAATGGRSVSAPPMPAYWAPCPGNTSAVVTRPPSSPERRRTGRSGRCPRTAPIRPPPAKAPSASGEAAASKEAAASGEDAASREAGIRPRWIISAASAMSSIAAAPIAYPMLSLVDAMGGAASPKTDRTAAASRRSSTAVLAEADRIMSTSSGDASASPRHPSIAAASPRPSRAGRTSLQASLVEAAPAISARGTAPRARASSPRSRINAAAPSEDTAPRPAPDGGPRPASAAGRCQRRTRRADWMASHSSSAQIAITAPTPGCASSICAW